MIKKTFNINLAGMQFVIDDDAYTLANNYLDAIDHLVRDPEERTELSRDIEARVAELLSLRLEEEGATIVTLKMVEDVIARIGQPNDFIETEEDVVIEKYVPEEEKVIEVATSGPVHVQRPAGAQVPPPCPAGTKSKRRLFRDPQNAVIAGVCSGIAHYIKIDQVWVRLTFVLLALGMLNITSFSWMVLVYIILWIVIPPADTPLKRMEMFGDAPTLGNLAKTVTAETESPYNQIKTQKGFAATIKAIGHGIMLFFGVVAVPVSIALCLGILGLFFAMIIYYSGASFGASFFDGPMEMDRDAIWALWCGVGACVTVLIPSLILVWYLIRSIKPTAHVSRVTEITLAVLWILAFIFTGVCCAILGYDINAI